MYFFQAAEREFRRSRSVMAITKCLIWVPGCDPLHGGSENIAPAWPHQRLDRPFAGLMESIMRKPQDLEIAARDLGDDATFTVRELRDDELVSVSGGSDLWYWRKLDVSAAQQSSGVRVNGIIVYNWD